MIILYISYTISSFFVVFSSYYTRFVCYDLISKRWMLQNFSNFSNCSAQGSQSESFRSWMPTDQEKWTLQNFYWQCEYQYIYINLHVYIYVHVMCVCVRHVLLVCCTWMFTEPSPLLFSCLYFSSCIIHVHNCIIVGTTVHSTRCVWPVNVNNVWSLYCLLTCCYFDSLFSCAFVFIVIVRVNPLCLWIVRWGLQWRDWRWGDDFNVERRVW